MMPGTVFSWGCAPTRFLRTLSRAWEARLKRCAASQLHISCAAPHLTYQDPVSQAASVFFFLTTLPCAYRLKRGQIAEISLVKSIVSVSPWAAAPPTAHQDLQQLTNGCLASFGRWDQPCELIFLTVSRHSLCLGALPLLCTQSSMRHGLQLLVDIRPRPRPHLSTSMFPPNPAKIHVVVVGRLTTCLAWG